MLIRAYTDDDWPQIWPFVRRILAEGETYCMPRDTTEAVARAWWTTPPGGRAFVAEDGGRVVGTAELAPVRPAAGAHVANAGFMVDPDAAGRGVGRALAEHVIGAARAAGFRSMQFNAVVETNVHAVKLWQSLGFAIMTTIPEAFDHPTQGLVGLHVMWQEL